MLDDLEQATSSPSTIPRPGSAPRSLPALEGSICFFEKPFLRPPIPVCLWVGGFKQDPSKGLSIGQLKGLSELLVPKHRRQRKGFPALGWKSIPLRNAHRGTLLDGGSMWVTHDSCLPGLQLPGCPEPVRSEPRSGSWRNPE